MLNHQFPYNQLIPLGKITISFTGEMKDACRSCWNTLYKLHGYLEAFPSRALKNDLSLLFLADAKYSFDLDDYPVSFARLYEAFSASRAGQDKVPDMLFRYADWFRQTRTMNLDALKPAYMQASRKTADLWRDKTTAHVKSYHTNLTLFTSPEQTGVLRELRKELDSQLTGTSPEDALIHMSLSHYQLRAVAPYSDLNHHTARAYTQLWIKSLGLHFSFLPLSKAIASRRETYQAMMRDIITHHAYSAWCLFMIQMVEEAAQNLLEKLKELQTIKKTTLDILEKYTDYHLPGDALLPVIFSKPFIKPKYLVDALDCHRHTAYAYLGHLVKTGLLIEKKAGREKLYLHKALFDVLSN